MVTVDVAEFVRLAGQVVLEKTGKKKQTERELRLSYCRQIMLHHSCVLTVLHELHIGSRIEK